MGFRDEADGPEDEEDDSTPSLDDLVERIHERRDRLNGSRDRSDEGMESPESEEATEPLDDPTFPAAEGRADFVEGTKTETLVELIDNATNLLLLGPQGCPADYDVCTRLMTAMVDELDALLVVSLGEPPDERVNVLRGYLEVLPEEVVILTTSDSRSGEARDAAFAGEADRVTIRTIPDPADVQRLGIAINTYLSEWEDREGDAMICFHSLTALLQAVADSQRVFRFVNVLLGQVRSAGAHAHYHMDPDAHDRQLLSTYRPVFDEALTFDEDRTVRIDY